MNADRILAAFAGREVDCLLIGGMNFLLRHQPVLTFDVDFWVRDDSANLERVHAALMELDAQWGATEGTWGPISRDPQWLTRQQIFCFTTAHGAVDVFRRVRGLDDYAACKARSTLLHTQGGSPYHSLADADMLACQLALAAGERRLDRVAYLEKLLQP